MLKALSATLKLFLFAFACLFTSPTLAVTSDGAVNTQINQNGNIAKIMGGEGSGEIDTGNFGAGNSGFVRYHNYIRNHIIVALILLF